MVKRYEVPAKMPEDECWWWWGYIGSALEPLRVRKRTEKMLWVVDTYNGKSTLRRRLMQGDVFPTREQAIEWKRASLERKVENARGLVCAAVRDMESFNAEYGIAT